VRVPRIWRRVGSILWVVEAQPDRGSKEAGVVWEMTLGTFTAVHVVLSLIGIGAGLVVLIGLISGRHFGVWTALFLAATVLTCVTGFGFPVDHVLPSHIVGVVSLVVLALAIVALYRLHLRGVWRAIYVVSAGLALYFNVFVGVVQAFLKVPALHALAPQQTEAPFVAAQLLVLAVFIVLTVVAARRFRGAAVARA
jgi:hypothetical protein